MFTNLLLLTDSYKASHPFQYCSGTEFVYSYIESRGGKWDRTVFYGLQMFLKEYLAKPITMEMVDEAAEFFAAHGEPFYREGWEHIVNAHGGRLPVRITAVPEGSIIPTRNVLATIVNTDPKCWWLTSFLETALLRAVWYPTTVCTLSWSCKQVIREFLDLSCDDPATAINFALHDFGGRGVSSSESAALGGSAHLVNFLGSDTVEGVLAARRYYGEPMAGFSIPAAEHSTITSWGADHEVDAYRNMLTQFAKPGALVAVVSDSYDIYNAAANIWGGVLKEEVLASGARIVVRPDSGDPTVVPVEIIEILGEKYGYTVNSKGFKVLHPAVRVIQGDGINYDTIRVILKNLTHRGWSAENLAFGMGGGLLQQLDRDTLKFAMKCSAVRVNGLWRDVFKDPKTDPGKASKRGQLALIRENGKWETVRAEGWQWANHLQPVFHNGAIVKEWTFAEIRERANQKPLD